jgi:predicted  nucleic acid-binding Zn-ribbon protein
MAESERNNLGAHVDLCAERYRSLEDKLDKLENRMGTMEEHIIIIRTKLSESAADVSGKTSTQLISIGTVFGAALLTGLITVFIQFILK